MKVLVFGCGPAGLMAVHGAVVAAEGKIEVDVVSKHRKSHMYGAQYLHVPIPGMSDPNQWVIVDYMLRGSLDNYRRKVYGPLWDGTVSPGEMTRTHRAWNISTTYDNLWAFYQSRVTDMVVHPADVRQAIDSGKYDLIINTIPKDALCHAGHQFRSRTIKAAGSGPGVDIPYTDCPPNTVLCNGADSPTWYRMSNIFGQMTVEWPQEINPPIPHAEVRKPLDNNCDCWPEIHHMGRYGSWRKGVLSHQAYHDAYNLVSTAVHA